jgi:hypothetical protein
MMERGVLPDLDGMAVRIGRALTRASNELARAVSFKTGCAAIAPMFAEVLDVEALVMSVVAASPAFTVHAEWRAGEPVAIIDSREIGFDNRVLVPYQDAPLWEIDYPDLLHVSIRVLPGVVPMTAGLDVISALLLPFFELSRRSDRLLRATSLLDVALEAVTAREADSVPRHIVERIGRAVDAPAAFFPARDAMLPRPPIISSIYAAGFNPDVIKQLFTLLGQIPDGPVQRAFDSPLMAAPVTPTSQWTGGATRNAAMLEQMPVSDYIARQVVHQNRPIGVILVIAPTLSERASARQFTSDDIANVASLAMVAGWALPLAHEYGMARRALQESEMLRHVAMTGYRSKSFAETLLLASGVAKAVFGADYVAVAVIAADWSSSHWEHVIGNQTQAHERRPMHHFTGEMRDWFRRPSWFVVRNVATDTAEDGEVRHIHLAEGLISSISVPVLLPSNNYGFLLIGFRHEHEFNDADIRFARSMGQTIAAAL